MILNTKVIIHKTITDAIRAFECDTIYAKYIIAQFNHAGCWGFLNEDGNIEICVLPDCKKKDLVDLFAHKLSHKNEEHIKSQLEENFAVFNAALCVKAYDLAKRIYEIKVKTKAK